MRVLVAWWCAGALALVAGCDKKPAPGPGASASAVGSAAPTGPPVDHAGLPHGLGKPKIPADNPQTEAKVKLGHQLFFDPRLSGDGKLSCYSCHRNEDGNGGRDARAVGAHGKQLPRHSPVIWNVAFLPELYWDGRSSSLEAQAKAALVGGNLGVTEKGFPDKAKELAKIPGYQQQFDAVFPGEGVTPANIVKALAAYERTLICDDTRYDRFAKGDRSVLTPEEQRGLGLFMGKGQCTACHAPPFFSTAYGAQGTYYNIGVGTQQEKKEQIDVGRRKVSGSEADFAAFKVPSLRNVAKSPPYFHDGSVATLTEAVALMAKGGIDNERKSPLLTDRKLEATELGAIVAFLGALDCNARLEEPKLP
jgi:cytochrome c peroxidase